MGAVTGGKERRRNGEMNIGGWTDVFNEKLQKEKYFETYLLLNVRFLSLARVCVCACVCVYACVCVCVCFPACCDLAT